MQPTVLKLIKVISFNIWPERFIRRKIFYGLNVFNDAKGIPRKLMKNERKMLLLCILLFFFLSISKCSWNENVSYESMGKHWYKNRRTNNSCNGLLFIIINFKDEHPNISTFCFSCSPTLAFVFCLSCFTP